ncbi:glycosyltransferase family 2 protein [Methylobacterium oryzihabitans]|nr:glycosyltransferase [Methylobacterium oryzihabitans]
MLRFLRDGAPPEDALLPGPVLGRGRWLGLVPAGTEAILLAAPESGFRIEEAALLSTLRVLALAARRRPRSLPVALYVLARGDARRFRNTLRLAAAVSPLGAWETWRDGRARPVEPAFDRAPETTVRVGLRMDAAADQVEAVRRSLTALAGQTHRDWRLVLRWTGGAPPAVADDARVREVSGAAPAFPDADAVGFLAPGDEPAPDALAQLAACFAGPDPAALAYGDEEARRDGRRQPRLKPGWSPDLALVGGPAYPGRPLLLGAGFAAGLPWRPEEGARALTLAAAAAAPDRVRHVARLLCRSAGGSEAPDAPDSIATALTRAGSPATVRVADGVSDLLWPLPDPPPLVSVVIPTRDRPDLIGTAVLGVLERTAYPALELVIVDNGSTDPAVHALYAGLAGDGRVRRLDRPVPFNFSALVNDGVAASTGSVVVLLNNDVEVLEPDWLAEMVRLAVRPGIGAVGAKLLYGNGRLQHAGVVVGLGGRAGHILRNRPAGTPGHLGRLRVAHEVAGVTAACLAVTRERYDAVGGFDAASFPIDFNDIDFCLRLAATGHRSLWTPRAVLAHHESVSRGPSVGPQRVRFEAEAGCFAARWRATIRDDPYYHPAFSVTAFGEDLE